MKAFRIKTRWWVIVSHREPVTIIKRNLTLTSHSPQYAQIPPRSLNPTVALVRSHCSRERMTRVHLICNHPKFWGTLFKWLNTSKLPSVSQSSSSENSIFCLFEEASAFQVVDIVLISHCSNRLRTQEINQFAGNSISTHSCHLHG